MRGPSEEARAAARRRYESGEKMAVIADSLGVHRNTLNRLRDSEGWDKSAHVSANVSLTQSVVQEKTQANVIDFTTRQAIEYVKQSGVIEAQADLIAESLTKHGHISQLMLQYAENMMRDAIAGKIYPGDKQSVADVFNAVVTGVGKAVATSRDIAGLKAGQISARNAQDDGRKKFTFAIAPKIAEQIQEAS